MTGEGVRHQHREGRPTERLSYFYLILKLLSSIYYFYSILFIIFILFLNLFSQVKEFAISIEKDAQQDDYLQGRMTGNPYNSEGAGLGPLMRDIKKKVELSIKLTNASIDKQSDCIHLSFYLFCFSLGLQKGY